MTEKCVIFSLHFHFCQSFGQLLSNRASPSAMPRFYLKNRTVLQQAVSAVRGKLMAETPQYRPMQALPPPAMPLRRMDERKGGADAPSAAGTDGGFNTERMLRNFYGANPVANSELVESFNTKTSTVGTRFVTRQMDLMREGWTEEAAFEAVDNLFNEELERLELETARAST